MKKYYKDHPEYREEVKKRTRQRRENNPEERKKWDKKYNHSGNNKKKIQLKYRYNLSYEDWLRMWEGQDGKCVICGESFTKPSDSRVDHNHKTNKIRGLLCNKCNLGIGCFNDNPKLTTKATEYLLGDK